MIIRPGRQLALALLVACTLAATPAARADVVVQIVGNSALATVSLNDDAGNVYQAEVTIGFDSPSNLTAESLNLTAELVDPADPGFADRLPAGVAVDPAFPVMITVEPPDFSWLFANSFEDGETGAGDLSFLNAYQIEVHTADLVYVPNSAYRLFKAPIGGPFADVTGDVLSGSVRMRGAGGRFSQFIAVQDNRLPLTVALGKAVALDARLLDAILNDALRLDLLNLLAEVQAALLVPVLGCADAVVPLDQFVAEVEGHAGVDIANLWRAERDVVNDAGELESLAGTLRFSLLGCAGIP